MVFLTAAHDKSEVMRMEKAEVDRDRNVWIITDEIYRRIHYGSGPAPSFLDLSDDLLDRVVVVTGVSKAYAMTGWRVGIALAPGPVAKAMAALQSHTTSGANQPWRSADGWRLMAECRARSTRCRRREE